MEFLSIDFWYQYDENINIHYLSRYLNIIKCIYDKGQRNLAYKEEHHIIPMSIDSRYNSKEYIISLTAREHYIIHMILAKSFTNKLRYKMEHAFVMMTFQKDLYNRDYKVTSRIYEKCKQLNSKRMKYIMNTNEMKEKVSKRQKKLIQDRFNGNTFFNSTGLPPHNKGKISITNGKINRYVSEDEIIEDGWYIGNTQRQKGEEWKQNLKDAWKVNKSNRVGKNHPMYGRGDLLKGKKNGRYGKPLKYINNGIINKMVSPEVVDEYLNNGWVLGQLRYKK